MAITTTINSFNIGLTVNGSYTKSGAPIIGNVVQSVSMAPTISYTAGQGANQADIVYTYSGNVVSGAPVTVDVASATTDAQGNALAMVRVKCIILTHKSATNNLLLGGGTNPATIVGTVTTIVPGGGATAPAFLVLGSPGATGWAVVAGTSDIVKIDASAGNVDFDLVIIGASA